MQLQIETYDQLRHWCGVWASGGLPLLVVQSRPGLGKSRVAADFASQLAEHPRKSNVPLPPNAQPSLAAGYPVIVRSHCTPLQLYLDLYDHAGSPVVLDDLDLLLKTPLCVSILKSLCESETIRTVEYRSTTGVLDGRAKSFKTDSPVLVNCNEWRGLNSLTALASRAVILQFTPSTAEVVEHIRTWETVDKPLLEWFVTHGSLFPEFSLRDYALALELQAAKVDPRDTFLSTVDPKLAAVYRLQKAYRTDLERLKHYNASRADYYRRKRLLGL